MDVNLTQKLRKRMAPRPRVRGRYNSSEIYAITHGFRSGKLTPEQWMHAPERTAKELLMMYSGTGLHTQIQTLLAGKDYEEEKIVYPYKDIVVVAKADFMHPQRPNEVWEFKTSDKVMEKAKPWQVNQVKLYCTIFEKPVGVIYQPVQDDNGIYLKEVGRVERDDVWFRSEIEKLYIFHTEVEKLWKAESGK